MEQPPLAGLARASAFVAYFDENLERFADWYVLIQTTEGIYHLADPRYVARSSGTNKAELYFTWGEILIEREVEVIATAYFDYNDNQLALEPGVTFKKGDTMFLSYRITV